MLEEVEAKNDDYKKCIKRLVLKLTGPYKELDHNKRISDEARDYDELIRILHDRLSDIDAVSSLLTDQHNCMKSLNEIDQHVDGIPVNSLSLTDVDQQLNNLQVRSHIYSTYLISSVSLRGIKLI